jgi:hypothetical protein
MKAYGTDLPVANELKRFKLHAEVNSSTEMRIVLVRFVPITEQTTT